MIVISIELCHRETSSGHKWMRRPEARSITMGGESRGEDTGGVVQGSGGTVWASEGLEVKIIWLECSNEMRRDLVPAFGIQKGGFTFRNCCCE